MKTLSCIALSLACLSTSPLHAENGTVRAAVITQSASADLRTIKPDRSVGRQSLSPGLVYEVVGSPGTQISLKVDATRVALTSTSAVRVRDCTSAELSAAQAKFNSALTTDARQSARKTIADNRAKAACATCPKVQAQAGQAYVEQTKALKEKNEALLKEALAWASQ
ncbi:MAG: hypothetical protein K8R23_11000 [Chthoniobacter sp.]|nr:hypothetical protein [Chthoniobacter sp.]